MPIVAAENRYQAPAANDSDMTPAEVAVVRFSRFGRTLDDLRAASTSATVHASAYVNHGRWLVDCPFGCGSAQYASRDDRRFWCTECDNSGTGEWVAVDWPDDVASIDDALSVRSDRRTANWEPAETIDELKAQNVAAAIATDIADDGGME